MTFRLLHRRLQARLVLAVAAVSIMSAAPHAALPLGNSVQQWNKIAEDTVVGSGEPSRDHLGVAAGALLPPDAELEARPLGACLDGADVEAASGVGERRAKRVHVGGQLGHGGNRR